MLETIYSVVETVVRNNIKTINEWLALNYQWFRTTTVFATEYTTWVLEYMEANFSNYTIYQAVSPFLISFEANTIIGGVIICLASRIVKSVIFKGIGMLSSLPGYIYWLSTGKERESINNQIEDKKRTIGLIELFKELQSKEKKTLKDNVEIILIQKELVERKVIEPRITVIPYKLPMKKIFDQDEINEAIKSLDCSITIEDLPHDYKYRNNKIYYKYSDFTLSLNECSSDAPAEVTNININYENVNVKIVNPIESNKVNIPFADNEIDIPFANNKIINPYVKTNNNDPKSDKNNIQKSDQQIDIESNPSIPKPIVEPVAKPVCKTNQRTNLYKTSCRSIIKRRKG